jgi:hypothetical protein
MVNGGFPQTPRYGFEMVDAPGAAFLSRKHQLKIYTESNESNFSRIFGELISMQTLAIYRPLLGRGLLARDQAQLKRDG